MGAPVLPDHDDTGTSRIVRGKQLKQAMKSGGYSDPVKAFQALLPGQGEVDFVRYFTQRQVLMPIQSWKQVASASQLLCRRGLPGPFEL